MVQSELERIDAPLNTSVEHELLVRRAKEWLAGPQRCVVVASDYGAADERPDAIGWPYLGGSIVVEVKVSRPDFLSDRQKAVRISPADGMGCRRWYLAPKGLIAPDELPDKWGLLEPIGAKGGLRKVVTAQKHTEWNFESEQRVLINITSDWRQIANQRARELQLNGLKVPKLLSWLTGRPIEQRLG